MTIFEPPFPRPLLRLLPALLLGMGLLLAGCDTTSTTVEDDVEPPVESDALSGAITSLSTSAALSVEQTQTLQALVDKHADNDQEPGQLWFLAADVHATLTSEQIQHLIQEHRQNVRRSGDGPGMHGPALFREGIGHVMEDLDLTDAQKTELRAIRAEYRDELKALRQKRREGTFDEADAERARVLRTEMRDAMREVLTEEQREQIEAHRDSVHEARRDALGLTDEQLAQLEALGTEWEGRPGLGMGPDHGGAPGEGPFASILTQEQREIVMIHRILLRRTLSKADHPASQ